jgi:hypothetical protein
MKRLIISLVALVMVAAVSGCAGFRVPFTQYRAANWQTEINRGEINSTCTDLDTIHIIADELEGRHLVYLRSRDDADALDAEFFQAAFGEKCSPRYRSLSVPEIKHELFGDIQTIADSGKLRELGGLAFEYANVRTKGGIEITLHIRKRTKGPKVRMVAIYRKSDGKVIHYNYSGTDNVDTKSRAWPLDQFFNAAFSAATKVVIP